MGAISQPYSAFGIILPLIALALVWYGAFILASLVVDFVVSLILVDSVVALLLPLVAFKCAPMSLQSVTTFTTFPNRLHRWVPNQFLVASSDENVMDLVGASFAPRSSRCPWV